MEEVKDNYNLVTETYDDLDRLIYKNYYRASVPSKIQTSNSYNSPSPKQPKKLLFQDVYTYSGERDINPNIKRVFQPLIDFIGVEFVGSDVLATAYFSCKSTILASGFIWSNSTDKLMNMALRPPNFLLSSLSYKLKSDTYAHVFNSVNAMGKKTYNISSPGSIYVKAFAQIETGTLFSKTLYTG